MEPRVPHLPAHIQLSLWTADRIKEPALAQHRGAFVLGGTAPDITAMTKNRRDLTHFTSLELSEVGSGVRRLFEKNPRLAEPSRLNGATRFFLAGYINHLVADETWILDIYRPHFGKKKAFDHYARPTIWDRALQLELDRRAREELEGMSMVPALLDQAEEGVDIGFIDAETLARWRLWVSDFSQWDFTWDRLRYHVRRMHRDDEAADRLAQEFLRDMPGSLQEVLTMVPGEELACYQEKTVRTTLQLVREYLGVS